MRVMDDAALSKLEWLEFRTDPGAWPLLFRVVLCGIGGITLLYAVLRGQISTGIAAVVLLLGGWVLGRFGAGGAIVDRKRREVVHWWTYGGKRTSNAVSVADGERVIIRSETKGQLHGRPTSTSYHVYVARKRGEVLICSNPSASAAREQAQQIGAFLALPFGGEVQRG